MVSTPRYSTAVPNDEGTHALYTVTTYSIEANITSIETRVMELSTGQSTLFSDSDRMQNPQWLTSNQILWLESVKDDDETKLWIGNAIKDTKW